MKRIREFTAVTMGGINYSAAYMVNEWLERQGDGITVIDIKPIVHTPTHIGYMVYYEQGT